jgi:dCTP diphosphatase
MRDSLEGLRDRLARFAAERDWERFHTPKNLAMAITGEAGELAAELQWSDPADGLGIDPDLRTRLGSEAADILIYLIRFADVTGLDLLSEAKRKIDDNDLRYSVSLSRGNADKRSG